MKRENVILLCKVLLIWSVALLVCWFLSGCKTQVVKVPEYHTIDRADTLRVHDSIYVHTREYIKGDTVHKDSIVYRDRWRDKTVKVLVQDSIPYPVEVEKIVYKRSGYDTFTSWFFWITVVLIILAVAWWCFKKFHLRR